MAKTKEQLEAEQAEKDAQVRADKEAKDRAKAEEDAKKESEKIAKAEEQASKLKSDAEAKDHDKAKKAAESLGDDLNIVKSTDNKEVIFTEDKKVIIQPAPAHLERLKSESEAVEFVRNSGVAVPSTQNIVFVTEDKQIFLNNNHAQVHAKQNGNLKTYAVRWV